MRKGAKLVPASSMHTMSPAATNDLWLSTWNKLILLLHCISNWINQTKQTKPNFVLFLVYFIFSEYKTSMYLRSAETDYELATMKRGINQQRSTRKTTRGRKKRRKSKIRKNKVYKFFIKNDFFTQKKRFTLISVRHLFSGQRRANR